VSKKYSYILLLVSVGLIATNLGVGTISTIKIPNTSINVPGEYIWGLWLFLFVPYINEIRQSGINLKHDFKKEFNSELCSWSKKQKEATHPDMYTPLIDLISTNVQLDVTTPLFLALWSQRNRSNHTVLLAMNLAP